MSRTIKPPQNGLILIVAKNLTAGGTNVNCQTDEGLPMQLVVSDADKYVYIVGNFPTQNSHWDNLQVKRADDFELFGQEGLPADCGALVLHGRVSAEHRKRLIDSAESAGVICVAPDNFTFEELNRWLNKLDIAILFAESEEVDGLEEQQTVNNPPSGQRVKIGDSNQEGKPMTEYIMPFFGDPSREEGNLSKELVHGAGVPSDAGKQATTGNGVKQEGGGMKEQFVDGRLTVKGLIKEYWLKCGEGDVGLLTKKANELGMDTSRATITSQKSYLLRKCGWVPPKAQPNGQQPAGSDTSFNEESAQPDASAMEQAVAPKDDSLPNKNEQAVSPDAGSLTGLIALALKKITDGHSMVSAGQSLVAEGCVDLQKAKEQAQALVEFQELARKFVDTFSK